jgi:hypothetical protein
MFSLHDAAASTHARDLLESAVRSRRGSKRAYERAPWEATRLWQALTVRLATSADRPAIARLAELEQAPAPEGAVLLGVVMQQPIAALSLSDGRVLADPYHPSKDVVELMRLRARQLAPC